jgi:hypothetical protein
MGFTYPTFAGKASQFLGEAAPACPVESGAACAAASSRMRVRRSKNAA